MNVHKDLRYIRTSRARPLDGIELFFDSRSICITINFTWLMSCENLGFCHTRFRIIISLNSELNYLINQLFKNYWLYSILTYPLHILDTCSIIVGWEFGKRVHRFGAHSRTDRNTHTMTHTMTELSILLVRFFLNIFVNFGPNYLIL